MIDELNDIFPNISKQKIWKILLSIKFRYKKYGKIGLSRLECTNFGLSERQLQKFIYYLRNLGAINKIDMVVGNNNHFKCNVYSLSKWFSDGLKEVKEFIKKTFEYINPLEYVKSKFSYRIKYSKLKFEVNGDKYIIHLRGRFKNKVYDIGNSCIINPLLLGV